jgi:predicted acetyltransferase
MAAYARVAAYSYNNLPSWFGDYLGGLERRGVGTLGIFDGGEMAAALADRRFDARVNGAMVKANGIGMVASAITSRRRGLVRDLIGAHLAQLREDGVALSLLYPFKFRFYGRMGWGFGERGMEIKADPREFAAYGRAVGHVREALYVEKGAVQPAAGETLESVIDVLDRLHPYAAGGWQLATARTRTDWRSMLEVSRGRRYVFFWSPGRGAEPQGYAILYFREERHEGDVSVREVAGATPDAWRGLFHLISQHDSQNKKVRLYLPYEHQFVELLDNPRVEAEIGHGPMVRAVDLPALLTARGTEGAAPGRCSLTVTGDALAPWNEGTWQVSLSDRGGPVKVERCLPCGDWGARADLEGPIDAISQLACGVRGVDAMMRYGLLTGHEGPGLSFARALFPQKPIWHNEYY